MGLFDGTALERPVLCEGCGLDVKVCKCPPLDVLPEKQTLKVQAEKRNKGKLVTSVCGFTCSATQIQELLVVLKNACGAGGSCNEDSLEIQGNHKEKVIALLQRAGYRTKG